MRAATLAPGEVSAAPAVTPPGRPCTKCGERKPLEQFHRQKGRPDGRHCWCKICVNTSAKLYRKRIVTAADRQRWNLSRRYGLTAAAVEAMIAQQGGACPICRRPFSEHLRPVVDHRRGTRIARGILCHPCNIKLPAVEDEGFLEAAFIYLWGAR